MNCPADNLKCLMKAVEDTLKKWRKGGMGKKLLLKEIEEMIKEKWEDKRFY